jgi:hypothetical protein
MIKNRDHPNLMGCMALCFEVSRYEDDVVVEKERPRHPSTPDDELRVACLGRVV